MWEYTDKVLDLFYNPRNQGAIADEQEPGMAVVFGEVGSIACGDALRLHLKIEVDTDTIVDARFQTFGCTSAIASSSALTDMVKGLTLDQALNLTNQDIADYLGGLPEAKMHCSVMGQEALEAAIFKYRGIEVEAHEEDDGKLICTCYGISEPKIRRVVRENGLTTVEQVTNYIKAGGGCGTCSAGIEDLIAAVWAENDSTPTAPELLEPVARTATATATATAVAVKPLTNLQKISAIQQIIDTEIRPFLKHDGGDIELHDVDGDRVIVQLIGACGSCPSSTETLKHAVEARLQERVLPSLTVVSV